MVWNKSRFQTKEQVTGIAFGWQVLSWDSGISSPWKSRMKSPIHFSLGANPKRGSDCFKEGEKKGCVV